MRVAIVQSSYLPWRGYFDLIASVDRFLFLDDTQFVRRSWRIRNQILGPHGKAWITVPVIKASRSKKICHTEIHSDTDWQTKHLNQITDAYAKAPYFSEVLELTEQIFAGKFVTISELNQRAIRLICSYLGIKTEMECCSKYEAQGKKTDRLIDLLKSVGASEYLSGPTAVDYLEPSKFERENIKLFFKSYDYLEYPQFNTNFDGNVSIIDLIAHIGPGSRDLITSMSANTAG